MRIIAGGSHHRCKHRTLATEARSEPVVVINLRTGMKIWFAVGMTDVRRDFMG